MKNQQDIRWIQRFNNYKKAIDLLREIIEETGHNLNSLNAISKEGVIQRFQFTFELAWKTLKDKMEFDGIVFNSTISPKTIFKQAYQSKYIDNIETWLKMTDTRNSLSHTYSFDIFDKSLEEIQNDYFQLLDKLYLYFIEEQLK